MKKPRLALVFDSERVSKDERSAASRGFGKFDVLCEQIDVLDRNGGLWLLKNGERMKGMVSSREDIRLHPGEIIESSASSWFPERNTMGLGITPMRIIDISIPKGGMRGNLGVSHPAFGGLVSIARFRKLGGGLSLKAIELAVAHEIGHVLGNREHCANDCLMQENRDYHDFVERFVKRDLGPCRDCMGRASLAIKALPGPYEPMMGGL
jgi:hypothetical protein